MLPDFESKERKKKKKKKKKSITQAKRKRQFFFWSTIPNISKLDIDYGANVVTFFFKKKN